MEGVWLVGLESLSLRTFPVMIYSKMVKRQWSVNLLVLTVGNLVVDYPRTPRKHCSWRIENTHMNLECVESGYFPWTIYSFEVLYGS